MAALKAREGLVTSDDVQGWMLAKLSAGLAAKGYRVAAWEEAMIRLEALRERADRAAREHGSYQLIRHETEFPAKPGKTELKGNAEITSASVEYRRKVVAP